MKPEEDFSLVQGGDCRSHYHMSDRAPTQDFLHGLQQLAKSVVVTGDYIIQGGDDFVQVSGLATVTLPLAKNGQEHTVVRTGIDNVTVLTSGTDLVCGTTSVLMTTRWMSLTFKAVSGGWIIT